MKALTAANSWRDKIRIDLKLSDKGLLTKCLSNNLSTGVLGITKSVHTDNRKGLSYLIYGASWVDWTGKKRCKAFRVGNIKNIDPERDRRAFAAAKLFRSDYEQHVELGTVYLFDPGDYFNWRDQSFDRVLCSLLES